MKISLGKKLKMAHQTSWTEFMLSRQTSLTEFMSSGNRRSHRTSSREAIIQAKGGANSSLDWQRNNRLLIIHMAELKQKRKSSRPSESSDVEKWTCILLLSPFTVMQLSKEGLKEGRGGGRGNGNLTLPILVSNDVHLDSWVCRGLDCCPKLNNLYTLFLLCMGN